MITFLDLGPKPTAHLFLKVPVPMGTSGWSWGDLPRLAGCLAKEYAYTAAECMALVHAYGRTISRIVTRAEAPRFTIVARGPVTGRILGMREWQAQRGEYEPVGEYLCGWKAAVRAYWEATGILFEGKGFDARSGPFAVISLPPIASAA